LHQQTHQGVRLDFILVKFRENFEKKFLVQIQLILIFFKFQFCWRLNTKKVRKKTQTKKNKTSINKQPSSKENSIQDANICQTRVKQPCQ
jgi:hypothetical protein